MEYVWVETGPSLGIHVSAEGPTLVAGAASDSATVSDAACAHVRSHPDGVVAFTSAGAALYGNDTQS